jgi:hypothetical protein
MTNKWVGLVGIFIIGSGAFAQTPPEPSPAASLNGVVNASAQAGSDVGAKINAAASQLAYGGEVYIPASATCYRYSTPIVINNAVVLRGAGVGTCLEYVGSSGIAMTWNFGPSRLAVNEQTGVGLRDLTIQTTNAGSTGLRINTAGFIAQNVNVMGFDTGVTFGSNTYTISWHNGTLRNNKVALAFPERGISNSGENMTFDHVSFANGQQSDGTSLGVNCVNLNTPYSTPSSEFNFTNDSFDGCQVVIGTNKGMQVRFVNPHFEDVQSTIDYPFVKLTAGPEGTLAQFINPEFFIDSSKTTQDGFVELIGDARANIVNGAAFVYAGTSVPRAWVAIKGRGTAVLNISGTLYGGWAGTIPVFSTDGLNSPSVTQAQPSNFVSKSINSDGQIVLAEGRHLTGDYWITWNDGANRFQSVKLTAAASSFTKTAALNITQNYGYGGQVVLRDMKIVLSGTQPQLVAEISNRNGSTGPLTVQWSGDTVYAPALLDGSPAGSTTISNNGLQQYPDGSLHVSGPPLDSLQGFSAHGTSGFTGTKTAGPCVFTIQGGIITNVTGC